MRVVHRVGLGGPVPVPALGYALDSEGRPATDPKAVLKGGGTVLPLGGPKGSGLAALVDVLAGVLSGAGFAGPVADQRHRRLVRRASR